MTTRPDAGLVTAALAVGMLVGAAGTIVLRDATSPRERQAGMDDMAGMTDMSSMMQMMAGMGGGIMDGGMMGGTPPAGPQTMPGPGHDVHHPSASPEPAE